LIIVKLLFIVFQYPDSMHCLFKMIIYVEYDNIKRSWCL